jgi:hypothetical protein
VRRIVPHWDRDRTSSSTRRTTPTNPAGSMKELRWVGEEERGCCARGREAPPMEEPSAADPGAAWNWRELEKQSMVMEDMR